MFLLKYVEIRVRKCPWLHFLLMNVVTKAAEEEKKWHFVTKTNIGVLTSHPQGVRLLYSSTVSMSRSTDTVQTPGSARAVVDSSCPAPPPRSPGKPPAVASRLIESLETRSCGLVRHQENDTHTHADQHPPPGLPSFTLT